MNQWVDLGINFRYFFARKTMFVKYAQGFIVLPGGLGTLDELFEAMVLVQTRKVTSFPIVLLGTAFWSPMLEWVRDTLVAEGMVSEEDLDLVQVVDDPALAVELVVDGAARHRTRTAASNGTAREQQRERSGAELARRRPASGTMVLVSFFLVFLAIVLIGVAVLLGTGLGAESLPRQTPAPAVPALPLTTASTNRSPPCRRCCCPSDAAAGRHRPSALRPRAPRLPDGPGGPGPG